MQGNHFGPVIWSVVDVANSGTLALTQQLSQLHTSNSIEQQLSSTVLPHCSNIVSGCSPFPSQVNKLSTVEVPVLLFMLFFLKSSLQPALAPQNSPNTTIADEEMVTEKISHNSHNL
jgi:hypothetical protein